jgi:2-polyprenyl-3-methyl-5-hydroxy-6-metoxy-1,4-benzoquinol methylase
MSNIDKAGEKYWTSVWNESDLPEAIHPDSGKLQNFVITKIHHAFSAFFESHNPKGKSIIEIGCGNSVWLPYLHKSFGLDVHGLDYSALGCEKTRTILKREGVTGRITEGDLFNPPIDLIGKFDFVISLGVVEHFTDTSGTLEKMKSFLKPGGIMITEIPNLTGLNGLLLKHTDIEIYNIHKPSNKQELSNYHSEAGMKILDSYYLDVASLLINYNSSPELRFLLLKKAFVGFISRLLKITWLWERITGISFPRTKFFSPFVFVYAQKIES